MFRGVQHVAGQTGAQQGETRRLACFRGQKRNSGHIKAQVDFRGELGTRPCGKRERGGRGQRLANLQPSAFAGWWRTLDVLPRRWLVLTLEVLILRAGGGGGQGE